MINKYEVTWSIELTRVVLAQTAIEAVSIVEGVNGTDDRTMRVTTKKKAMLLTRDVLWEPHPR